MSQDVLGRRWWDWYLNGEKCRRHSQVSWTRVLPSSIELRLGGLGQRQEVLDTAFLHGCLLSMRVQLFLGIFLNRGEHRESRGEASAVLHSQQVFAHQRFQAVEHLVTLVPRFFCFRFCLRIRWPGALEGGGGIYAKTSREDGQGAEQPLVLWGEQVIAPGKRVAQRLLPLGQIARAVGE
jgi:hypothetical protein